MTIFKLLAQMKPFLERRDWDGLEQTYRACCQKLSGEAQTQRIAALDFAAYENALDAAYAEAIELAQQVGPQAIYFEYDLDNGWQSNFFLCSEYSPESEASDDWACDWFDQVPGPEFPAAGEVYSENNFDETPLARGSTLYLVARTVAAFGRCADKHPTDAIAVCLGFHDQTPIMRVSEME